MVAQQKVGSCPNCGEVGDGPYCASCGQDNRRARLESRAVLSDAFQNLVGWDSALGRTLAGLVRSPGPMAVDYVEGRRRRYVNPARFALLSLALWLLFTKVMGIDPLEASGMRVSSEGGGADSSEFVSEIRTFLGSYLNVLLYLALPLRAFLLRLFFRSSGRNLAECLVLVLYLAGFGYLIGFLFTPLVAQGHSWCTLARNLLVLSWSIWASRHFFGRSWWSTAWRLLIVTFLHLVGTVLFFGAISVPVALWKLS